MKRHSKNSKVKKGIELSSILMVIISIEFLLNYVTIHFNSEEISVVILMVIINLFLINYVTKDLNVKYISVVISMVIINWFLVNYVTKYLNIKDISVVIWMDILLNITLSEPIVKRTLDKRVVAKFTY